MGGFAVVVGQFREVPRYLSRYLPDFRICSRSIPSQNPSFTVLVQMPLSVLIHCCYRTLRANEWLSRQFARPILFSIGSEPVPLQVFRGVAFPKGDCGEEKENTYKACNLPAITIVLLPIYGHSTPGPYLCTLEVGKQ